MASSSGSFGLLGLFVISQLASHKTGSAGFNLQHCEIEPLFNNWPIINPFVRKENLIFLEHIFPSRNNERVKNLMSLFLFYHRQSFHEYRIEHFP